MHLGLQALAGRVRSSPGVPLAFSSPDIAMRKHMPAEARQKPVRKPAKKAAAKMPTPRVEVLAGRQAHGGPAHAPRTRIRSGPRGGSISIRGPFAVFLHAPEFGELAQKLGGFSAIRRRCRRGSRSSRSWSRPELWRAQYEWFAHVPQAERAGVTKETISDLHKGRMPKSLPKDERAIYDFIQELYKTRRVSDKTYKLVVDVLGEPATVEFVGILGYYVLISMILNVFRMSPPEGQPLPFAD